MIGETHQSILLSLRKKTSAQTFCSLLKDEHEKQPKALVVWMILLLLKMKNAAFQRQPLKQNNSKETNENEHSEEKNPKNLQ